MPERLFLDERDADAAASRHHRLDREAMVAVANGDGMARHDADNGAEGHVAEVMTPLLDARGRDVRGGRVSRCARGPSEMTLDHGCRRKAHRRMARRERELG